MFFGINQIGSILLRIFVLSEDKAKKRFDHFFQILFTSTLRAKSLLKYFKFEYYLDAIFCDKPKLLYLKDFIFFGTLVPTRNYYH
jgi:hypothetical protein